MLAVEAVNNQELKKLGLGCYLPIEQIHETSHSYFMLRSLERVDGVEDGLNFAKNGENLKLVTLSELLTEVMNRRESWPKKYLLALRVVQRLLEIEISIEKVKFYSKKFRAANYLVISNPNNGGQFETLKLIRACSLEKRTDEFPKNSKICPKFLINLKAYLEFVLEPERCINKIQSRLNLLKKVSCPSGQTLNLGQRLSQLDERMVRTSKVALPGPQNTPRNKTETLTRDNETKGQKFNIKNFFQKLMKLKNLEEMIDFTKTKIFQLEKKSKNSKKLKNLPFEKNGFSVNLASLRGRKSANILKETRDVSTLDKTLTDEDLDTPSVQLSSFYKMSTFKGLSGKKSQKGSLSFGPKACLTQISSKQDNTFEFPPGGSFRGDQDSQDSEANIIAAEDTLGSKLNILNQKYAGKLMTIVGIKSQVEQPCLTFKPKNEELLFAEEYEKEYESTPKVDLSYQSLEDHQMLLKTE